MIVTFNESSQYQAQEIISKTKDIAVLIKDNIEGDINLTVRLLDDCNEQESFTKYVVENAHKAEIRIFNPPQSQYVRIKEPITLGTYMHQYILKMDYQLDPSGANNLRVIKLVFSISKK